MKFSILPLLAALCAVPALAYDGDMDIYHEFKEELSLVRDGYVSCLNMAMENATENDAEGWFKLRDKGGAATWADLEYDPPAKEQLPHLTLKETPYGFQISGADGAYKVDAKVRVVTRDTDIFYDVQFAKGSNAPGKEIFGEVFRNDRVVFYDESTPCKRKSVTCIHEYAQGTLGK
ncbi:MAG: hypothetical protein II121_02180 [Fibrobacter sp.]|nr:hypothetical protein [Fibrobacter sp.]